MQQVAESDGFRRIFFGNPEIGGRFSALSVFGLTAAAGMRLSVERFLQNTREMVEACKGQDPRENPGAILGLILGVCQRNGRDKLTIFTSAEIYDLGAWMEQLVAESTGKNGVSIIPIDRDPVQPPAHYGGDRVFVYLKLRNARADENTLRALGELERSAHPFITIEIGATINLRQEFFRWEFATAVAGSVMGINPFDQADVESGKIEARKITDEYEKTGSLPDETPFFEADGVRLFSGEKYAAQLNDSVGEEKTLRRYLTEHISRAGENDYFALLAYVEMNDENARLLQALRQLVLGLNHAASVLGF